MIDDNYDDDDDAFVSDFHLPGKSQNPSSKTVTSTNHISLPSTLDDKNSGSGAMDSRRGSPHNF